MDLVQDILNILIPLLSIFIFFIFWPLIVFYKFLNKFLRNPFHQNTDLTGKVALITGASSGIGEHLAYEFAKGGAELVLVARREDRLRMVAEKAMQLGCPNAIIVCGDVSNIHDCKNAVDKAMETFSRLDYVVNNAGIAPSSLFEDNIDDFVENLPIMNVNFWGSIYMTRFVIPHLRHSKGKIIVIASLAGCYPTPTLSIYSASKAAMISFYEALRMEIGSEIGITIVAPGLVDSEITQSSQFKGQVKVGFIPLEKTERCAKAILRSASRGERFLMEPSWIKWIYFWYMVCPELIEWANRRVILKMRRLRMNTEKTTCAKASKAAVVSFYETLRVEVGSDIGITIVNPGLIESEMTKGKFMDEEGHMIVDKDLRDVEMSVVPVEEVTRGARGIVNSACRGDRYWVEIEPSWMIITLMMKVFFSKVMELLNRVFLMTSPGTPRNEGLSKKILDISGLKQCVYPESLLTPDIKRE